MAAISSESQFFLVTSLIWFLRVPWTKWFHSRRIMGGVVCMGTPVSSRTTMVLWHGCTVNITIRLWWESIVAGGFLLQRFNGVEHDVFEMLAKQTNSRVPSDFRERRRSRDTTNNIHAIKNGIYTIQSLKNADRFRYSYQMQVMCILSLPSWSISMWNIYAICCQCLEYTITAQWFWHLAKVTTQQTARLVPAYFLNWDIPNSRYSRTYYLSIKRDDIKYKWVSTL